MNEWKIPKNFINELLIRTNIVNLIKSKLSLKKKGNNYLSLCPFHNEKTPSFTVSFKKQFYYCFGCNAHGNVIDFLMNYEKLSFLESIEQLCILSGTENPNKYKKTDRFFKKNLFFQLMKKVNFFYTKNLFSISSQNALNYLKKRKITQKIIELFSIGYSGNQANNIPKKLLLKQEFKDLLMESKLINFEKNYYDHFRNRIIFPIRDRYGNINGYGGRSLSNESKPKYLNSSESIFFQKRNQIYGIYETFKNLKKLKKIIVVEGYFDVISLFQFNINNVVAILGTAITLEQIKTLFQICDTIIYCYDGDSAGKIASWNTLKISLSQIYDNKIIKFIFLPEGSDPDSIIRKEGALKFQHRIKNATCFSKFLFDKLSLNRPLKSIEEKSRFSILLLKYIKQIPGEIIKLHLLKLLGSRIGILESNILNKFLEKKNIQNINYSNIKRTPMRMLIGLLIQNPMLSRLVPFEVTTTYLEINGFNTFLKLLNICIKYPNYNTGQILELYRNTSIEKILKKLAKWDHLIEKNQIEKMFLDLLMCIYRKQLEKKLEYLIEKERKIGLKKYEKKELWNINISLSNNILKLFN